MNVGILLLTSVYVLIAASSLWFMHDSNSEMDIITESVITTNSDHIDAALLYEVVQPTTTTSTTTTSTTTTIYTPQIEDDWKCSQWLKLAYDVGWEEQHLKKVGRIMWAESRCLAGAVGDGSYGLMQIQWNVWKNLLSEAGIAFSRNDLLIPIINLRAALFVSYTEEEYYGCRFRAWYRSGRWC